MVEPDAPETDSLLALETTPRSIEDPFEDTSPTPPRYTDEDERYRRVWLGIQFNLWLMLFALAYCISSNYAAHLLYGEAPGQWYWMKRVPQVHYGVVIPNSVDPADIPLLQYKHLIAADPRATS